MVEIMARIQDVVGGVMPRLAESGKLAESAALTSCLTFSAMRVANSANGKEDLL